MGNKIFASLKNNIQVILFDEKSDDYTEVIKLFKYDIDDLKKIDFLDNLHSTLGDDELYYIKISEESEGNFFSDIQLNLNSLDNNKANQKQYKDIDVIYLIDTSKKVVCLKKIYPTQHMGAKKLLGFDLGPTYKEEPDKISLSAKVDVYYDINKKILYFRNFNSLKLIIKDAVKFYREATKEEAKEFFSEDMFEIKDTIFENTTDKFKKRLGFLIDKKIDFSDKELMKKYKDYDKQYNNKLVKKNGKYILKTKPQLENFIKLLEQLFYETPITKEKREVDNFRKINKNGNDKSSIK